MQVVVAGMVSPQQPPSSLRVLSGLLMLSGSRYTCEIWQSAELYAYQQRPRSAMNGLGRTWYGLPDFPIRLSVYTMWTRWRARVMET